jgi:UPF0716 protein FxsA
LSLRAGEKGVLARFLLLLILLPAIEIVLLIWIAMQTSVLLVLGLLLGAGVLGALLARQQGLRAIRRIDDEVRAGRMPADALFDALLISLAGVLLILPGFLSDVVAIGLLFPPTRKLFKAAVRRGVESRVVVTRYGNFEAGRARDEIIDVKVIESPPRGMDG